MRKKKQATKRFGHVLFFQKKFDLPPFEQQGPRRLFTCIIN